LILLGEFFDFDVFGKDGIESIILDGLEFGLVVEIDAVNTDLRVELLGVGELKFVDFLLELRAEHLSLVLN
jgi:hypothetical protein